MITIHDDNNNIIVYYIVTNKYIGLMNIIRGLV